MYYKVVITKTAKSLGSKENYQQFDKEAHNFEHIQEVKNYLTNCYGKSKRVKMYIDTKVGETKQVGWIYCFTSQDCSHNSKRWYQQDWVSVTEVEEKTILVK